MASLRVKDQGAGPVIYGRWRHDGRYIERPVGRGWLIRAGEAGGKPNGRQIGSWRERRGRPKEGFLTPDAAREALPAVMEQWRSQLSLTPQQSRAAALRTRARALDERAAQLEAEGEPLTFAHAAELWYRHRRDVKRLKTTTLREYRSALDSRILPAVGSTRLFDLTARDIVRFRDDLAALRDETASEPLLTPRTINKLLTVVSGVLAHACRPEDAGGLGLGRNPAMHVDKLGERAHDETDYLNPAEVIVLARAMGAGAHRDLQMRAGGVHAKEVHRLAREADDARDAAAVMLAGFAGLRRGELAGLRWSDVSLSDERLTVRRAWVLGEVVTPKAGRSRIVPLARQVAKALADLDAARQRHAAEAGIPAALRDDDHVLGTALGAPLDARALVRRYKRACLATGLRVVRWHGLRHTFVSMAREGFGIDAVRAFAGHDDARTAQRYAHARSAATDAARLSELLAAQATAASQA